MPCPRTTRRRRRTRKDTTLLHTLPDARHSTVHRHRSMMALELLTTEERLRPMTDREHPARAARGIQPSPILRLDQTITKITTTIRIHRRRTVRPPLAQLSMGQIRHKGHTPHTRRARRTVQTILIPRISQVPARLDIKLHPVRLDTLQRLVLVKVYLIVVIYINNCNLLLSAFDLIHMIFRITCCLLKKILACFLASIIARYIF